MLFGKPRRLCRVHLLRSIRHGPLPGPARLSSHALARPLARRGVCKAFDPRPGSTCGATLRMPGASRGDDRHPRAWVGSRGSRKDRFELAARGARGAVLGERNSALPLEGQPRVPVSRVRSRVVDFRLHVVHCWHVDLGRLAVSKASGELERQGSTIFVLAALPDSTRTFEPSARMSPRVATIV